jgi:hypothetical protein
LGAPPKTPDTAPALPGQHAHAAEQLLLLQLRHEPPGGSAFPHRDALFYCEPGAAWDDPALHSRALGWAASFWRALCAYGTAGYINVPNAPASNWEREYYGANPERLRQVKAKYDPHNVFNFEQSVPVAN